MKFEEQFPSREITILNIGKGAKCILMRNCLDKAVVRKAIDFIANNEHPEMNSGWQTELKRELGL